MLNPIRLSKENESAVEKLVKDANLNLLTAPRVVNAALEKGLPSIRKIYVKSKSK